MYYLPEEIDFNCFFMSTKYILKDLLICLNPYNTKFFKINELYIAVNWHKEEKNLHINSMAGKADIKCFNEIINLAKKAEVETMTFITSENNLRMQRIAKRYKFNEITRYTNIYPDGSNGILFIRDIV